MYCPDPNNEVCNYYHVNTLSGGKWSNDFTEGFGSEQFIIKDSRKGTYILLKLISFLTLKFN